MNKKEFTIKNRAIMLTIKVSVIIILCLVIIWTTNFKVHEVLSQNSSQQIVKDEMTIKDKEKSLTRILQDKNLRETSPEKITEIIQQIGKLKNAGVITASDSIPILVDLLDFKKMPEKSNNLDEIPKPRLVLVEEMYPAIETLSIIGKPSLPFLVKVIEENDLESTKSNNAFLVINYIFRADLSAGIEFLEKSKANSQTFKGKDRLSNSIEKLRAKWLQSKN
jgi:hypothetical protein